MFISPWNDSTGNILLCELDHFQGQNANDHQAVPVDFPPLIRHVPLSCTFYGGLLLFHCWSTRTKIQTHSIWSRPVASWPVLTGPAPSAPVPSILDPSHLTDWPSCGPRLVEVRPRTNQGPTHAQPRSGQGPTQDQSRSGSRQLKAWFETGQCLGRLVTDGQSVVIKMRARWKLLFFTQTDI